MMYDINSLQGIALTKPEDSYFLFVSAVVIILEMKLVMQVVLLDERAILFLWNCEIGRNLGNTQSSSSSSESWVYRNLVHSCTDSIFAP